MISRGFQMSKRLPWSGHRVVALAGAMVLASGLAQLQAADPQVPPVPPGLDNAGDIAFVQVLKENAALTRYIGKGHSESAHYPRPGTTSSGACDDEASCKQEYGGQSSVKASVEVPMSTIGVSPDNPITEVIPTLIVKVGKGTCWWSCSAGTCDCVCTRSGGTCPAH